MQHLEYTEAIRREGHALANAAQTAGLDATVPSCPEWRVADLLSHLGRIHRWVTAIVEQRPGATEQHWSQAEPPAEPERLAWFTAGVDPFADALAAADPATEVWTWSDDKTVGFWARRQAHETAMHRWDAQTAAGAPQPIDAALAADGIDEFVTLIASWRGRDALQALRGTIHLHCTDTEGEWLLRLDDGLTVTREHAKGDVAARGPASDLLLVVSNRRPLSTVDGFGDAPLLERFLGIVRF